MNVRRRDCKNRTHIHLLRFTPHYTKGTRKSAFCCVKKSISADICFQRVDDIIVLNPVNQA